MRNEFGFDAIRSTEFCVNATDGNTHTNYLVPSDRSVQSALREMLTETVRQFEAPGAEVPQYELAEKYAGTEPTVSALASEEMEVIRSLHDEEGWPPNPQILRNPAGIAYYFAVFRDNTGRKLLGVRRAAQFKGVVKSHLVRLFDDSLTMVQDHLFKLDHDFDFLVTPQNVYILHPTGFERIAEIEALVSASAREKALALGQKVRFADFARIAEFVTTHKRAAKLIAALSSRGDLDRIKRSRFIAAAEETGVELEENRGKILPASDSEVAFLELLDDRRYTTSMKTGPKDAYVASSRRRVRVAQNS